MQHYFFLRLLVPVTLFFTSSDVVKAIDQDVNDTSGNDIHQEKTPGRNSESYPDISIPESVLRGRKILQQLNSANQPEIPEVTVRPDRPEKPDRPERPEPPIKLSRPDRPAKPIRPERPDKPDKPDKPGKP